MYKTSGKLNKTLEFHKPEKYMNKGMRLFTSNIQSQGNLHTCFKCKEIFRSNNPYIGIDGNIYCKRKHSPDYWTICEICGCKTTKSKIKKHRKECRERTFILNN